jgi:hypothetical protein
MRRCFVVRVDVAIVTGCVAGSQASRGHFRHLFGGSHGQCPTSRRSQRRLSPRYSGWRLDVDDTRPFYLRGAIRRVGSGCDGQLTPRAARWRVQVGSCSRVR